MRVVADYDVDRAQVHRWRHHSRALLIARELSRVAVLSCVSHSVRAYSETVFCLHDSQNPISGGYCGGVPPLPIPNREVKPACADGTAMQCGRVGGRLLFFRESPWIRDYREGSLFFCVLPPGARTGGTSVARTLVFLCHRASAVGCPCAAVPPGMPFFVSRHILRIMQCLSLFLSRNILIIDKLLVPLHRKNNFSYGIDINLHGSLDCSIGFVLRIRGYITFNANVIYYDIGGSRRTRMEAFEVIQDKH